MGRINFAQNLIDRKGITDRVTLNGMTLMNWKVYNLPMNKKFIYDLRSSGKNMNKPGLFFQGEFLYFRTEAVNWLRILILIFQTIQKALYGLTVITLAVTGISVRRKGFIALQHGLGKD